MLVNCQIHSVNVIYFQNLDLFLAFMGLSTLCVQNFLCSYVKGVYTIRNGAYERNGFTAYSVGCHNIVLNWMTKITDLLQFFVVSIKFGSDYASREVVLCF